ncbi:MAG: glycosyltransferase, partial [Actinobacteria bacterium]|nr:glycosyltransferase [Actinomycetota bacterium]
MKILILNDYAFVEGGAGKVAIESAIGLTEKGNEVIFFSAVGPVCDALEKSKIKKIICLEQKDILSSENKVSAALSGIKNKNALRNLRKLFSEWRPDIVHAHGISKALSWA